jgi:hypothetical protein
VKIKESVDCLGLKSKQVEADLQSKSPQRVPEKLNGIWLSSQCVQILDWSHTICDFI